MDPQQKPSIDRGRAAGVAGARSDLTEEEPTGNRHGLERLVTVPSPSIPESFLPSSRPSGWLYAAGVTDPDSPERREPTDHRDRSGPIGGGAIADLAEAVVAPAVGSVVRSHPTAMGASSRDLTERQRLG